MMMLVPHKQSFACAKLFSYFESSSKLPKIYPSLFITCTQPFNRSFFHFVHLSCFVSHYRWLWWYLWQIQTGGRQWAARRLLFPLASLVRACACMRALCVFVCIYDHMSPSIKSATATELAYESSTRTTAQLLVITRVSLARVHVCACVCLCACMLARMPVCMCFRVMCELNAFMSCALISYTLVLTPSFKLLYLIGISLSGGARYEQNSRWIFFQKK